MPIKRQRFQPYSYQKSQLPTISSPVLDLPASKKRRSKMFALLPSIMITAGSIMIANVLGPIFTYQIFTAPSLQKANFISPVSEQIYDPSTQQLANQQTNSMPQVLGAEMDYTDARNWFPTADFFAAETRETEYTVTIPSLDIEDAKVVIGGGDLDSNLIQYPGTSDPGQLGAPVIFGHSVLRQFYNPSKKNPNRYISIFSKIMTMDPGDQIFIDYDGIKYTYEVKDKVEVKPEDVFILEQRYNNKELKLITCVPEGTYLRRGVIVAQLVDLE